VKWKNSSYTGDMSGEMIRLSVSLRLNFEFYVNYIKIKKKSFYLIFLLIWSGGASSGSSVVSLVFSGLKWVDNTAVFYLI
jgi:hypothetical protein